jgi:3-hydroxyisobutyrate dehydrogenase-like beta-hydroxyacid dehydrogenase
MADPHTDSSLPKPRVGLIGLGLMGRGMGLSLLRRGFALGIVAHTRRETAQELLAAGAWEAASPSALAAGCDELVLCLPSIEATRRVLFGDNGVTQSGRPGLLVIECSTLMPQAARDFQAELAEYHIAFVDAPVTRGPREALAGTLNALVGGEPEAVERAVPVLQAFCEQVFRLGACGQGYAAKLISNFLAFSNLAAVAEGMATAGRAGIDPAVLMQALAVSGAQSRVLDGLAPVIAGTGESRSRVTVTTAQKDVAYYAEFAAAMGTAGPVSATTAACYAQAVAMGLGDQFTPGYLRHVAESLSLRA